VADVPSGLSLTPTPRNLKKVTLDSSEYVYMAPNQMTISEWCILIRRERLRKTTKIDASDDILCPSRDLNLGAPTYQAAANPSFVYALITVFVSSTEARHKSVSTERAQHTEIPLPRDKEPLRFGSTRGSVRSAARGNMVST
jgi:hypothetical protein